jgi:hypothetical protein
VIELGSQAPGRPCRAQDFLRRLAALIPGPRFHQARRHGVFANRRRAPWARLLRRASFVEALSCPHFSTRTESVPLAAWALLTDPEVVRSNLAHLELPSLPPPVARARVMNTALAFPLLQRDGQAAAAWENDATAVGEEGSERPRS